MCSKKSVQIRGCIYPNQTYAEILKTLNVDVDHLPKLELSELLASPPLQGSFFNGLKITNLELSYTEETLIKSRVPDDVTNYVSTLKEFYLIGAVLPTLPNNSALETMTLDSGRSRNALGGCSHLRQLTLINWHVHSSHMEGGWISSCHNLTELVLHAPSIDTAFRVLTNATSLLKLELSKLPRNVYDIKISITNALYLESIKIHKSPIYRVVLDKDLPLLADIDFSDNDLWNPAHIRSMLIHVRLLTNATLSNNPRLDLCEAQAMYDDPWDLEMPNLKRLVATRTATTSMCFQNLQALSLVLLDFSSCNISALDFTTLPTINSSQLELRLNHNAIEQVSFEHADYNQLLQTEITTHPRELSLYELHLQGNHIKNFTANDLPDKLNFLDLSSNRISYIDNETATALFSSKERRIKLAGNSIVCDCQNQAFLTILKEHKDQVDDYDELVCKEDGNLISNVTVSTLCVVETQPQSILVRILLPALLAVIGLTVLAIAVYFRYGKAIKIFLYARGLCLCCLKEEELDANRPFDVFISFSHDDEDYVLNEFLQVLEKEHYKTCVHNRDWIIGEWIPKQISVSIEISRRTLIVLSRNFVKSVWGMLEFRMAHASMLNEGRARLIVVVLDDIVKEEHLDPELKNYLRTNTYLETSDPWFWDKLRFALPRRGHSRPETSHEMPVDVSNDFGPYGAAMPVVQRNFDDSIV
ncbi:toll-like receptor 1 [Hyposmocoma kahamanoa]|uniref:toll-like receptor 1 n=1 Tax=Hyposmocoma kahamanoa TaxID=1477025 RepID=UPI000E6D8230|nr:toll-like receptor 1 [Hyposmocoma kahamanoa]